MSSKNPEKSLQRSESHLFWHEHAKGNKPQAAQAIDKDEEDALFLTLNSSTPIQLRFKELCDGFIQNFGLRAREYQSNDPLLSSTAPFFTGANIGSISRCIFQIFNGNVKIVQNERKRRIVIDSDEDDWLWRGCEWG